MLISKISYYLLISLLNRAFPFFALPFIASSLGTAKFGEYGVLISVASFLTFFTTLSFDAALNKFYEIDKIEKTRYLNTWFSIILGFSIIYFIGSLALLSLFSDYSFEILIFLAIQPIFSSTSSIFDRYLRIINEDVKFAKLSIFRNLFQYLFLTVLLLLDALTIEAYLWLLSINAILFSLFYLNNAVHVFEFDFDYIRLVRIWKYVYPLIPNKLVGLVVPPAQMFMLSAYFSLSYVGLFTFSQTLANGLNLLSQSIFNAINPLIFKKYHQENYSEISLVITQTSVAFCALTSLVIYLSDFIIEMYAPVEFQSTSDLFPLFIFYIWVNFQKNVFLNFSMLSEETVPYVPFSTYLYVIAYGSYLFVNRLDLIIEDFIYGMVMARSLSVVWLFYVSFKLPAVTSVFCRLLLLNLVPMTTLFLTS
ncbi:lipopolysaccharide biosynthesis protein [Rhodobacteraceae bacterium nBUS_24]